jgi:DNA (cytosine-5)-methyltransferase 1
MAESPSLEIVDPRPDREGLAVAGLFAGIGGIELGLHRAGHESRILCEIDEAAQRVLREKFPEVEVVGDVRTIDRLPEVDLVAAGFPCQDLSQAGRTAGISGAQSGLVGEVFRLIGDETRSPTWLLLENVPFMLQLDRGEAMRFLVDSLEVLGYSWAYRVVDTRAFGLPQRRKRVLLLASKSEEPAPILFTGDASPHDLRSELDVACGFYWTEGTRGLGWAVDAVPTLKGGSGVGIPSPPAIRLPEGAGIVVPEIRDAERLQGFPADWTAPGSPPGSRRQGERWKMVGNAVSVPVSEWLGQRLTADTGSASWDEVPLAGGRWPPAARGAHGERFEVAVTSWPVREPYHHLAEFLEYETPPLSERAAAGFLSRARTSKLRFPAGFLQDVEDHRQRLHSAV